MEVDVAAMRLFVGTLVGGTLVLITGVLVFLLPSLRAFYSHAMDAGSAAGVAREAPVWWAVFLAALSYGALVTLAIGSRPAPVGAAAGARVSAVTGFPGAVAGGVIAVMLNRVR